MADITNGFVKHRVTLSAGTEQKVLFPGNAEEVAVANLGAETTLYCAVNRSVISTDNDEAYVFDANVRGGVIERNDVVGPIAYISLLCEAECAVEWMAR